MGKKSRKSRNKKPVNPQVPSNNSNNGNPSSSTPSLYEEPPVVVAETENPVGPPDGGIICASPPIIDNVDSTNDKDNVVQNAERNDSKVDTKASDETVLIKSPTQDAVLDQVQMDFTNNHNANIENSGCNENQHNKFVEPKPLVIAGPSGAGKGTLIGMLMKKFPSDQFGFSVSHTTRQPREGEMDGVHYNFSTVEQMKEEIDAGKFIEYANVHGNYYGTSFTAVSSVQSKGQICILDIDVQGVQNVKKSSLDPYYVFIAPPSMETLETRLRGRGTENEESIKKRLENARGEMEYGQVEGNFDKYLVNCDLNEAADELCAIVHTWYPFLQQQQQHGQTRDESKSEKNPRVKEADNAKSYTELEANAPDDEAKDEMSEAKTEVVDNTTDDAMLEDLDSCLDDGDVCEALETSVSRFEEDHPEDEEDADVITDSVLLKDDVPVVQIDKAKGEELNGKVTESEEIAIESDSTPLSNTNKTQDDFNPTSDSVEQNDEAKGEELNGNVTQSEEIAIDRDSTPLSNTDNANEVFISTSNTIEHVEKVEGNELDGKVTKNKEIAIESDSKPKPNTDSAQDTNKATEETTSEPVSKNNNTVFYTLQELKVPIDGVDWACREDYLSDDDIVKHFGMNRDELKALPKWKRQAAKKKLGIF